MDRNLPGHVDAVAQHIILALQFLTEQTNKTISLMWHGHNASGYRPDGVAPNCAYML